MENHSTNHKIIYNVKYTLCIDNGGLRVRLVILIISYPEYYIIYIDAHRSVGVIWGT